MKPELVQWVNQPRALTEVRKGWAERVECGEYSFDEAQRHAYEHERMWLIELVRDGEMKPSDAEAEAVRLGCRPLVPVPDPALFDPMLEPLWTLYMALAWIMWRTPDDVRRHWGKWRAASRQWMHNGRGYSQQPLEPASFFELRHDALITEKNRGNAPRVSAEDAKSELWRALEAGDLAATGIDARTRERVEIPACEFIDLDLHEDEDGLFLRAVELAIYLEARLSSEFGLLRWPSIESQWVLTVRQGGEDG